MVEPKKSLMTQLLRLQAIRGGERELDSLLDVQKSANAAAKALGVDNVIFDRPNAATRALGTPPDLKNFFLRSPEGREDWLCLGYWDGHTNPLFSYPITQSWCSAEKINSVISEWVGVLDFDKPKPAVADADPVKGLFSPAQLADQYKLPVNAVKKRLERYREKNHNGWIENMDARPREPRFTYDHDAVRYILEDMKSKESRKTFSSRQCPAKKI